MTELERHVRRYPEMAGKIALVTGGTSGIGLATAQTFAREGAVAVLASRSEERAQTALQAFPDGSAVSWVASLDPSTMHRFGSIDIDEGSSIGLSQSERLTSQFGSLSVPGRGYRA